MRHYRAPRWLVGPHSQTIWPALAAPRPHVAYRRVRWDTPDGDFIDVDFALAPGVGNARAVPMAGAAEAIDTPSSNAPLVVLFHGLEGSSSSHYALATMAAALERGWRGAVAHFRGCGGALNRAPRAYHSGDSEEIDWNLRRMHADIAHGAPLFAVGVSLGGNALLKWLGERGEAAAFVTAAAAVSAPHDLQAGAESLARGFSRLYTANFMKSLKRKSLATLQRHPGLFDRERMLAAKTFFDFDDAVTAPMHGFGGAIDYWTRSSCARWLGSIAVPTVVLNARNDPFQPAAALTDSRRASRHVRLEYPADGGHVGFIAPPFPGRLRWLPEQLLAFFDAQFAGGAERADAPAPAEADPEQRRG